MSVGSSKQTLCRLCLNIIGDTDFKVIEEIISEILQAVLPSLDLETKSKHMCGTCHVKLIAAFNFKSMCIDTEDVIISYINPEQMPVVDLKDVYSKKGNVQLIAISENQKICRLCMQLVTCEFKSLNEVDVDIIINYIPEINIDATNGPVICKLCFDSLCTHHSFVKNCLNVQENYEQCCNKTEKIEIKTEQSDLSSNPNSEEFKTEKTSLDAQEHYTQSYIKTEEIVIKAEESDQDSDLEDTIDDCVYQCRAREVQIDEGKSRIQKSEASSTKGDYKNQLKFDAPEPGRYEYNDESIYKDRSEVHENPSEAQMYKCHVCGYQFKKKSNLRRHQVTHKDPSKMDLYKCDTCSFKTKYKHDLKRHLLLHRDPSKVQIYKCNACNYRTAMKQYLKKHHLTHKDLSEIQMHKCDVCCYETMYKGYLKRHQLLHKNLSEIKLYKCDVCSYETKRNRHLKVHQLTHKDPSEVEMYKCDLCSYETKYKGDLKKHQLTHKDPSEIQMYKCDSCSFESVYKGALMRHLLSHKDPSRVQIYKCESCSYETKNKGYLKLHNLKKHGNSSKV